jgi:predicted  nucleic acid-binding Zn-ribbon protein
MDKQKLTPTEIDTLKSFISKYENFSQELEKFQKGLEDLDIQKQDLMEGIKSLSKQLDKVREDEAENTKELISKYGEFNLNLETFEIEKS